MTIDSKIKLGINLDFAELCNGSTADSDSVCLGSNPSSAVYCNNNQINSERYSLKYESIFR